MLIFKVCYELYLETFMNTNLGDENHIRIV